MFEDDAQLERSGCSDASAPSVLVARYGDTVYSVALSMCSSSSEAAEVTLNTFARAAQGIAFRPLGGSVRTWLCGTAVKIALDERQSAARSAKDLLQRLESRLDRPGGQVASGAGWPESSEVGVNSDQLTTAVREGLQAMDNRVRAAFVLHDIAALSLEDVATILRTSRRETRARVHQARLSLQQVLDDYFCSAAD
jgi:RNA polymerase sigma factor (sigma-70 family)